MSEPVIIRRLGWLPRYYVSWIESWRERVGPAYIERGRTVHLTVWGRRNAERIAARATQVGGGE